VETLLTIDVRAAKIRDGVRKLKFLRRELRETDLYEEDSTPAVPTSAVLATLITAFAFALTGTNVSKYPQLVETRPALVAAAAAKQSVEKIWLVEKTPDYWVYSNGLQIRTEYLAESRVRHYPTWSRRGLVQDATESAIPAGIVFHTTESLMLPLEAGEAHSLVRTRKALLGYVRSGRLYNYVIDRFGQVFQVVPDDEVAFHAGHSVWADDRSVYVGLNDSFLGVAFEARTDRSLTYDAAQIRSGRMLTDLLRGEYSIPASNCVTHAQVSVNPANMQIGYHTDWAANFPFREFGLPDGYATALPSIELFGFSYNHQFLEAIGGKPWPGLLAAEADLRRAAEAKKSSDASYRDFLQRRFRAIRSHKPETAEPDRT
jgi:hypothetical protein